MCLCVARPPERQNEGHVAVRFGHYGKDWSVLLDGVEVAKECTEAQAGPNGWVILVSRQPNLCRNGLDLHERRFDGTVEVRHAAKAVSDGD